MAREARQKIARALKVNVSDVEAMEVRLGAADQSLNAPMHAGGEEEHRQDFLADVPANPEEAMIGMRDGAARSRRLAQAVSELTPRERGIVHQRRLTEQGATLEELGRELGVSKERMRQLEHRALVKLKTAIERQIKTTEDLLPPDLGELDRCIAAIDEQIAAGDKARSVTREKYRCRRDLMRPAEAGQQVLWAEPFPSRLEAAVPMQYPLRFNRSRGERVDADILCGMIDRHDLGKLDQRAFCSAVGGSPGAADTSQL